MRLPIPNRLRYLWLALGIMALNSCSAYVTPASDDPETLKELKRKSVPTSQLAPAEHEVELRNSSRG